MQAPLLLDKLLKKIQELQNVKGKALLIEEVKELYEVCYREAYAAGAERLEEDDEL